MTLLATWGCAFEEVLKMLPIFKMADGGQLQKKLWAQKLKLFKFYYHIPHHTEMCR